MNNKNIFIVVFIGLFIIPCFVLADVPIDATYHETVIRKIQVNDFGYFSTITSVGEFLNRLLTLIMSLIGGFAMLGMIVGGIMMMWDGLEDGQAKKGKEILINSSIGLAVALSSMLIVTLAQTLFYWFGT